MKATALILTLTLAASSTVNARPRDARATYRLGAWRLRVLTDGFTGGVSCDLRDGAARIEGGRLIWKLGKAVNSEHAVYRLDGGRARLQNALLLPATANLENPSDGNLVATVGDVRGGHVLEVRAGGPGARVQRLDIHGLDDALATARRLNCQRPMQAPAGSSIE